MNITETTAECPHCKTHMVQLKDLPGVFAGCPRCGGIWLDNALSAEAAKTPMSNAVHDFVATLVSGASLGSDSQASKGALHQCPVCQQRLKAVGVRDPEMTVDICQQHGTFFDRYELDALHRIAIRNAELAQLSQQIDVEQAARDRAWAMSQAAFQGGLVGGLVGAALMAASYDEGAL